MAQAKLYRWVDDQGNVHYSDTLPPAASQGQREVLNESGRTLEAVNPQAEQQQKEEEARKAAEEAAQAKAREEQAKRDHVLLKTFTAVKEIEALRNDRVAAVEAAMNQSRERRERMTKKEAELAKRASSFEEKGKPVPEDVAKELADIRKSIDENDAYMERREAEREDIIQSFAKDIARFKELKGQ